MKLIIGLGNPGREYEKSRHNIGFMCLRHYAKRHKLAFNKKQCHSRTASGIVEGVEILLARPQTYMNASGQAVAALMQKFKVAPEDLIIIHDDMDLPLGKIRIRPGGSSGGHRGIASIINQLQSNTFNRIRIGIDHPGDREKENGEVIDYVLSRFSRTEKEVMETSITKVSDAIDCLIINDIELAMNRFN